MLTLLWDDREMCWGDANSSFKSYWQSSSNEQNLFKRLKAILVKKHWGNLLELCRRWSNRGCVVLGFFCVWLGVEGFRGRESEMDWLGDFNEISFLVWLHPAPTSSHQVLLDHRLQGWRACCESISSHSSTYVFSIFIKPNSVFLNLPWGLLFSFLIILIGLRKFSSLTSLLRHCLSQPELTAGKTAAGVYQLLLFVSSASKGGDEDVPQDTQFPGSRKNWKKVQ